LSGLRYELDLPLKFRKSFQRSTGIWIAAAAVVGVMLTVLPRKKKIVVKAKGGDEQKKGILEAGFAIAALKFIGRLARPAITSYLTRRLAAQHSTARSQRR
jgi:hypothetical protein